VLSRRKVGIAVVLALLTVVLTLFVVVLTSFAVVFALLTVVLTLFVVVFALLVVVRVIPAMRLFIKMYLLDNQQEKISSASATLPARPACWQAGLRETH
jgi:uncharacterized membrane protein